MVSVKVMTILTPPIASPAFLSSEYKTQQPTEPELRAVPELNRSAYILVEYNANCETTSG